MLPLRAFKNSVISTVKHYLSHRKKGLMINRQRLFKPNISLNDNSMLGKTNHLVDSYHPDTISIQLENLHGTSKH